MSTIYKLKRKTFTKWDETDNLKRMNDADILSQQKKSAPGVGNVAYNSALGALTGTALGSAVGGVRNGFAKKSILGGMKTGGIAGAILGGGIMGLHAINKNSKAAADANFYNKRLEYAQNQAKRREAKDWKANMTQREGYSY